MKKGLLAAVMAAFLLVSPAMAQLRIGFTGGLNITHMTYGDGSFKDDMSNKAGFFFGPTAMFSLSQKSLLGFDVSAYYDHRTARYIPSGNTVKMQSVVVPLNLRLQFYDYAGIARAFFFAGPQIAFNVGKKSQYLDKGKGSTTGNAMELNWVPKSTQLSMNFGIGAVALDRVQVRVSYNLALQKTGEFERTDLVQGTTRLMGHGKSSSCQVSATYFF